jgi:hypothetical protein
LVFLHNCVHFYFWSIGFSGVSVSQPTKLINQTTKVYRKSPIYNRFNNMPKRYLKIHFNWTIVRREITLFHSGISKYTTWSLNIYYTYNCVRYKKQIYKINNNKYIVVPHCGEHKSTNIFFCTNRRYTLWWSRLNKEQTRLS